METCCCDVEDVARLPMGNAAAVAAAAVAVAAATVADAMDRTNGGAFKGSSWNGFAKWPLSHLDNF